MRCYDQFIFLRKISPAGSGEIRVHEQGSVLSSPSQSKLPIPLPLHLSKQQQCSAPLSPSSSAPSGKVHPLFPLRTLIQLTHLPQAPTSSPSPACPRPHLHHPASQQSARERAPQRSCPTSSASSSRSTTARSTRRSSLRRRWWGISWASMCRRGRGSRISRVRISRGLDEFQEYWD